MANNFTLLRPLHLLLSTSFCLNVSLERNINLVHEILRVKYNTFRKFSPRNIFAAKRNDEKFSRELFVIGTNTNENKANHTVVLSCS